MAEKGTERREHGLTTEDAIGAVDATAEADSIVETVPDPIADADEISDGTAAGDAVEDAGAIAGAIADADPLEGADAIAGAVADADPIADAICGAGHQVLTKATLSLPFLSWTGERK